MGRSRSLLITAPPRSQLYTLDTQNMMTDSSTGQRMGWFEIRNGRESRYFSILIDRDGRLREKNLLDFNPRQKSQEFANWQEAKRLEDLLFINGIRRNRDERSFGDWLLRSTDSFLSLSEGLSSTDRSLSDVVRRYDEDNLFPNVTAARDFQMRHRSLFTNCMAQERLCGTAALGEIPLSESLNENAKNLWNTFYQQRLTLLSARTDGNLLRLCDDINTASETPQSPVIDSEASDQTPPQESEL